MEFPTEATVAEERYGVERNDIADDWKGGLERNPERVIGANERVDYGYLKLRGSSLVAEKAVRRIAEPQ